MSDTRKDNPLVKSTSALLLITALLLTACGGKRVPLPNKPTHSGHGWIAAPQEPGKFLILSKDLTATIDAVKALCPKEYVCFGPEYLGDAMLVERKKK